MKKSDKPLPEWEKLLSSAAHLQQIIPEAVLVGGTASAIHAKHRMSLDADHILGDLKDRFEEVLSQLEEIAEWKTARIKKPVLILGSLDGIETGILQLRRTKPLETETIKTKNGDIVIPTKEEILRIKAVLILRRNATRDYLDFCALSDHLENKTIHALNNFDELYDSINGQSPMLQLAIQLANPKPYDLNETDLPNYKNLKGKWTDWGNIENHCQKVGNLISEKIIARSSLDKAIKKIEKNRKI